MQPRRAPLSIVLAALAAAGSAACTDEYGYYAPDAARGRDVASDPPFDAPTDRTDARADAALRIDTARALDAGRECVPGARRECYTGPLTTRDRGECHGGQQTCGSTGRWPSYCTGERLPRASDLCGNDLDDDCDGGVDEGCACPHDTCTVGARLDPSCSPCVANICNVDPFCCETEWDALCVSRVATVCGDDSCGPTCDRSTCEVGPPLDAGCDACIADICAVDPYCCGTWWDSICVGEVVTVCGDYVCPAHQGSCAHSPCVQGASLANGCDNAGAGCVADICAADPFCCASGWDGICVGEVQSVCDLECP